MTYVKGYARMAEANNRVLFAMQDAERARSKWLKDAVREAETRIMLSFILTCDWRMIPVEYWRSP